MRFEPRTSPPPGSPRPRRPRRAFPFGRVGLAALFGLAALAGGCHGGGRAVIQLRKEPGFDGAWITTEDDRVTALDCTGDVTKLRYGDRTFTFRGLTRFHGHISAASVRLVTDNYVIEITAEKFSIEGRRRRYVRPLAALPKTPVVVFEGGNFFLE